MVGYAVVSEGDGSAKGMLERGVSVERDELQAAQVALSLASQLMYNEPSDQDVTAFLAPGMFQESPFAMEDEAVRSGLAAMDAWCSGAAAAVARGELTVHEAASDLRRDWLNLLMGVGEPKAPSWSGYYLNPSSSLIGESSLQVRRIYKRFGFEMEHKNQEPDDHLGIMLGFIAVLIGLELDRAASRGAAEDGPAAGGFSREDRDKAARRGGSESGDALGQANEVAAPAATNAAAECQMRLLEKYILPWLPLWRWSVERFARTDFYRGVGDFVFGLVRCYACRFGFRYVSDETNPHFVLGS